MKRTGKFSLILSFTIFTLIPVFSSAQQTDPVNSFDLPSLIRYAIKHNPALSMTRQTIEIENQGLKSAQAERMPRIDVTGGYTRYRYANPLTPIVIEPPLTSVDLPDFERNVYDGFATFSVPLFRGGRLVRGVAIATLKKSMAQDFYTRNLHDLTYNVTSVYYKLAQLEQMLQASEAQIKGLEAHRRDVESLLKAGAVPKLDLLKSDTELAAAIERKIQTRNTIVNAREILRSLIGMDGPDHLRIELHAKDDTETGPLTKISMEEALARRPDYKAALNKIRMYEERVASARGKRLPDIYASGDYGARAGDKLDFKENWTVGVRLFLPVFDFGRISAEVDRERFELMNAKEDERALRLTVSRELKEAEAAIVNAIERISVSEKAVLSAKEQVRIEDLRYRSGDNTSTDVINAEAALIRARSDHYQALFDRRVAQAFLKKAMGILDTAACAETDDPKQSRDARQKPGNTATEGTK
ncbi:MAG: TolC family protein [Syntrophorhabdaceae bacterium]